MKIVTEIEKDQFISALHEPNSLLFSEVALGIIYDYWQDHHSNEVFDIDVDIKKHFDALDIEDFNSQGFYETEIKSFSEIGDEVWFVGFCNESNIIVVKQWDSHL